MAEKFGVADDKDFCLILKDKVYILGIFNFALC